MTMIAFVRRGSASAYFALVLLAALLLASCGKQEAAKPAPPTPAVKVLTLAKHDVLVSAEYVAQTQSSQAVNIQARVSGFLDKRVYVEGSVVKAGQVLFMMDQKPFQAQLDAAKAALQRNQAALEVAKSNLARTKPLAQQNALSQKDLDDAQGQFEQAAAAVEGAKAQVEEAQLNLSYTTIRSPVTGVSSFAAVADGTYVSPPNAQLTTISVLSPMWINFSLSENEITRIRDEVQRGLIKLPAGGQFIVEIDLVDGTKFPYSGRITFANPSFNPQTGTFQIRATVDNPSGVLRPNQYVRVKLLGGSRPNAITVPQRAVQQGGKGHFVWVVNKDDQAELRPVTVGDWYGDQWFIDQGLTEGERVVVDGGQRLTQGMKVAASPYVPPTLVAPAQQAASPPLTAAPSGTAVYFARGQATLDAAAMNTLRMKAAETLGIGTVLTITGYADASGKSGTNVELAKKRAEAVRNALMQLGIQSDRIRLVPPVNVTGSITDDEARRVDIGVVQ
jgi:membrane fusion protein (multidrug efflux system)